ncbi:MAG: hypothetical protein LBB88_08005 [Planctomycetaceae bacterium]|jgi:hypothetical protein|nr:hypothetical protein [Planctomycetaceae bacterium]
MNYHIKKFVCLFALGLIAIGGCSSNIPDGFPTKLVKFSVTIQHDGKPIEGVAVWLYSDDADAKYHVNATTNADGIALMKTSINSYSKTGSPSGTFKGTLMHRPKVPSDLTKEEWQKLNEEESEKQVKKISAEVAKMKLVPAICENLATSPLKITVPENGGNVAIEITDPKTFTQ